MPDTGFLFLSLASMVVGTMLFLFPQAMMKFNQTLNHTMVSFDKQLIRHRYLFGLLTFLAGYAFFRISLLLPVVR